jgi:DNA invertase Pin-like site-specific DNA recombinase
MIAIYLRVSSPSQKADSQQAEITRWLEQYQIAPDRVRWFVDTDTGKTLHRPAFRRLQTAIFADDVHTVLVWKLERLAPSLREGVNTLADWCQHDVRVVSVTQQLDLDGTLGHLIAGLLFRIAEIELQHTRERQAAGIALAKQRGVYTSRKQGTTKAKPARALVLGQQGLTVVEIARALGVKERTVYNYLQASGS